MIYINPNSDKIISARECHVQELTKLVKSRIRKLRFNSNFKSYQINFLEKEIMPKMAEILGGLPIELMNLFNKLELNPLQKNAIKKLFNYSEWFCDKDAKRYNAYELANNLDINTCVYCNRNYTSTILGIIRPQFDHYFSKDRYPLLALSFYNLIPSCVFCNSTIKGQRELSLNYHLHPYADNCLNEFRFSYYYDTNMKNDISISLKYLNENSKAEKTFEFFKTKRVYNAHTEELKELIKIREAFSDKYLEILSSKVLTGTEISKSELYQLAFGVYSDDDKISMRPFSKFKKDILVELGIIA